MKSLEERNAELARQRLVADAITLERAERVIERRFAPGDTVTTTAVRPALRRAAEELRRAAEDD